MTLGDVIARLSNDTAGTEALLALNDLPLLAQVEQLASERGLSKAELIQRGIAAYVENAGDEEWTTLIGLLSRAPDPGMAFLRRVLTTAQDPAESPVPHRH